MKISATILLISVLLAAIFTADASSNLRLRHLEDAGADGDDAVAAGDDAVAEEAEEAEEAGDDAVAVDDAVADDYVTYNGTMTDRVKDYSVSTYQSVPAEWSNEQWGFFAALMFVFGMISSLFFFFFVFPCCCPRAMRTAYARFIADEDTKKVQLIKK